MAHSVENFISPNINEVTAAIPDGFALGTQVRASDNAIYELVKAGEAITQYSALLIDKNGSATMLTTTNAGAFTQEVGIAMVAATNAYYFWALRSGPCSVRAAADCAANAKLYTTATAGVVDDASTTLIQGLRADATAGGSGGTIAANAVGILKVNG